MAHQDKRIQNINKIKNTVYKASDKDTPVSEEKLIAEICYDSGITRRTVKEYIDVLVNAGAIKRELGILTAPKRRK